MKLFHNDMSVCAQKVRMVLAFKGVDWESVHLNLRAGDQHKPSFKKINPKGVIPVLQHDGHTITESTTIIEFLEEVFPNPALMTSNHVERAKVRGWMLKLDAGLHDFIAVISFCVAFRFQLIERYKTQKEMDEFLGLIKDPGRFSFMQDVLANGLQSKRLTLALYNYDAFLNEMALALKDDEYLVGSTLSLADFSFLPYLERLEQLNMADWWSDKPQISTWLKRVRSDPAYQKGMLDWYNHSYIELMNAKGSLAWPEIKILISTLNES